MNNRTLAVFGISGRTGQALASAAAVRDWPVRGLVRATSLAPPARSGLTIVRGDIGDRARVTEVLAGADAVCCVLGPRPPYQEVFCAAATATILTAMRQTGVRRVVCQTGAMVGPGNRTVVFEWLARSVARRQPATARDRVEQERLVQQSGMDWTLIKPPRLTNGSARHAVKADLELRVGLLSRISRADLAEFTLDVIEQVLHVGDRLFVRG